MRRLNLDRVRREVTFDLFAQQATLEDYLAQVLHAGERIRRLEQRIDDKAGNAHFRRILGEAAWFYRHRPYVGPALRKRQEGLPPEVVEMAWKAQHRLHRKYRRLIGRGKANQQAVTAVALELAGFVWAIGSQLERAMGVEVMPAGAPAHPGVAFPPSAVQEVVVGTPGAGARSARIFQRRQQRSAARRARRRQLGLVTK